ncbi:endonuclease VII domain-containing protein [Streptomyces mirabilis]|uniref:endonuclease VII domain-containing protein n=1 Tax=Streptomyces mirabilis TaxID=68239 RepID=UPI0033D30F77
MHVARGLCKRHYNKAQWAGTLPVRQPRELDPSVHSISNVASDERTADCAICGPGARIRRRRRRKYVEYSCLTAASSPEARRLRRVREQYGLSAERYLQAVDAQGGLCLICKERSDLVVDHCHESGRVRGLLCRTCNLAIGLLRDDPERARSAADYLAASPLP